MGACHSSASNVEEARLKKEIGRLQTQLRRLEKQLHKCTARSIRGDAVASGRSVELQSMHDRVTNSIKDIRADLERKQQKPSAQPRQRARPQQRGQGSGPGNRQRRHSDLNKAAIVRMRKRVEMERQQEQRRRAFEKLIQESREENMPISAQALDGGAFDPPSPKSHLGPRALVGGWQRNARGNGAVLVVDISGHRKVGAVSPHSLEGFRPASSDRTRGSTPPRLVPARIPPEGHHVDMRRHRRGPSKAELVRERRVLEREAELRRRQDEFIRKIDATVREKRVREARKQELDKARGALTLGRAFGSFSEKRSATRRSESKGRRMSFGTGPGYVPAHHRRRNSELKHDGRGDATQYIVHRHNRAKTTQGIALRQRRNSVSVNQRRIKINTTVGRGVT